MSSIYQFLTCNEKCLRDFIKDYLPFHEEGKVKISFIKNPKSFLISTSNYYMTLDSRTPFSNLWELVVHTKRKNQDGSLLYKQLVGHDPEPLILSDNLDKIRELLNGELNGTKSL